MIDLRLVPAALAVWVAAWLLTGSGVAWSGPATWIAAGVVAAACLCLTATAALLHRAAWPTVAHAALAAACVLAVTASAHVQLAGRAPLAELAEQRVTATLTGVVVSQPEPFSFAQGPPAPGTGQYRWVLAARALDARGVVSAARAHVQVLSSTAPRYGATVTVSGGLRPADAGAAETARLAADGASEIRAPPSALRVLDTHRTALLDVTDPLPAQARGLVPGAAIGDTTRLPEDLAEEMRATGLTHITAVSGGHFAVVVAVLTLLCSSARLPRPARVALVALASLTFVALVRPEPAVLRAAVMAAFALTGVAIGRPAQSVPALAASVVGLLVVDPWLARSFGFVLSAAATAGLVLLAAPLAARLAPWTGDAAAFALAVPLAAQAACGPVLVLLDPSVSTVSVLANLLAAPALVPATVLGLVATVLAPGLPALAGLVAWAASAATWWIAGVAHWCAGLPGAMVPWLGGPPGALLLAVLTAVVLWAVLRRAPRPGWPESWRTAARSGLRDALGARRQRLSRARFVAIVAVGSVAVLVVVVAVPRLAARSGLPADWQVAACDVGQGDALALRTGPTSAVVVDVGPDGPAAGRCLDQLGVTRVDLLVLSHFHADHVGGLGPVLAGREVAAALVSPVPEPAANAAATGAALAAAGVPVRAARAGERGTAGALTWQVLLAGAGEGANDSSVVLAARTAGLDVLTLGDLEEAGQADLVPLVGPADVVKVAHHGSAVQSRALAERVRPAVALVSSGRDNDYGHPTDEALELYAGVGAAVVRTDECGTVALVVREQEVSLAGC
ncbi:competence protein ComEC [Promicromonospora umidemergens]|uniref:ComEC/Rec2 family competence protein n=1 Tax=Promicromonospora umidemergens TaxID=629679 RepID=A0ABP8X9K7_9MICO|nr:ComEC/Rec2 family competence protein [Promicromonospora umidemergens]MCP2281307.1 competence protein ComEC [Promicromonospora umidemergens]